MVTPPPSAPSKVTVFLPEVAVAAMFVPVHSVTEVIVGDWMGSTAAAAVICPLLVRSSAPWTSTAVASLLTTTAAVTSFTSFLVSISTGKKINRVTFNSNHTEY